MEVKGPLRHLQTDLRTKLWTTWGRIGDGQGTRRDRPVEDVGTTGVPYVK